MKSAKSILMLCAAGLAAAQNCSFSLQNVGTLNDGQLRLGYGQGASNVTFTLNNGYLTSSLNYMCYISAQTQLQCNTPTQTNADSTFSISNGQLSYNGSTSWWSCDAGTGGSNLYTTKYYSQCVAATLNVVDESASCTVKTSSTAVAATTSSQGVVATTSVATTTSANRSCFGLSNVGSLCDGQLRLNHGSGAVDISFSLGNGYLISSLGFMCYISSQTQLQCNTPPQTNADSSFSVSNGQLSYNGSTSWWSCDAGTGGSNLYTTKYYSQCVPATLTIVSTCATTAVEQCMPTAPTTVPSSCIGFDSVGSLADGQLRLGFGTGAVNVTFTIAGGYLNSSLGLMCYISAQTQLQCNTPPQTTADSSFGITNGQLSYSGSTSWWSCDAGTGGSNLYNTKYYSQCVPAKISIFYTTKCGTSAAASQGSSGTATADATATAAATTTVAATKTATATATATTTESAAAATTTDGSETATAVNKAERSSAISLACGILSLLAFVLIM